MFRRLLTEESGYSLVEVIVSIMILTIAIIPMFGMFDMGLKSATTAGNYDGARALANANLEKVRSLSYADAAAAYKPINATPTPGAAVSCDVEHYDCEVTTTYVDNSFNANSAATTKMLVAVTVEWDGGKTYSTTGLIAQ